MPWRLEISEAKLHCKVGIIESEKVIVGSYNWTPAANNENDENTLVIKNADIAQLFTDAFNELWHEVLVAF